MCFVLEIFPEGSRGHCEFYFCSSSHREDFLNRMVEDAKSFPMHGVPDDLARKLNRGFSHKFRETPDGDGCDECDWQRHEKKHGKCANC